MTKLGKALLPLIIALGLTAGSALAGPAPAEAYTGEGDIPFKITFTDQNLTQVREFAGDIGADVIWSGDTGTVTIEDGRNTLVLQINSETASINGKNILVTPAPRIENGRTVVSAYLLNHVFGLLPGKDAGNDSGPRERTAGIITEEEVLTVQQSWGEGIVHIGSLYSLGGDYEAAAIEHIQRFYGYDTGKVLFKPTLAREERFRSTFQGALSYFIGGDISEDKGFATAPFSDVRWENEGVIINGNMAVSMGVYYFTPADGGDPVEAEYAFSFTKNKDGDLKIILHGSYLPYSN